ncbi:YdcF family protein [Oculatella sp. LEGE 06141]|nr:YdcF family protein [Oculatella sp. LEGE 06141]
MVVAFRLIQWIPIRHGKRQLNVLMAGLLILYCSAFFSPTFHLAEHTFFNVLPRDSGETVDAIVVLGRGKPFSPSRVELAAHLWKAQRAPFIFASGINDAPILLKLLRKKGVPASVLQGEDCSRTTYENAQFTAEQLRPQGIQRILLVTDTPHMLRSMLTFQGFGFQVIPVPSLVPGTLDRNRKANVMLREYMGLVAYGLKGRFFQPNYQISQSNYPSSFN